MEKDKKRIRSTTPSAEAAATPPKQGGEFFEPQPEFVLNERTQAAIRSDFAPPKSLFRTRVVTEMLDEVEDKPRSMPLFDDFWLTGEMAVCFGERGVGKSILAVQIADSIARGKPLAMEEGKWTVDNCSEPEDVSTEHTEDADQTENSPLTVHHSPLKRVLYFDFELSSRQFEARYCFDPDPGDKVVVCPHRFSPNFLRSEIDRCVTAPKDFKRFEDFVLASIETEVRESNARVVIIDNIDRFNGEIMRTRDIAYVMNRLKKLKASLGLSILVLAHLPRRNPKAPLAVDRLMSTRTLCAFADNVFAIGQCRWDERCRYLKHLKARSTDLVYDSEYVPTFLVFKQEGNFLSFTYEGLRREETLLDPYLNKTRLERSDQIKEMAARGDSQRAIAHRLDMSLGSVNRALRMWSPSDGGCNCRPTKIAKTVEQVGNAGSLARTDASASDLRTPDEIEAARQARALATHNYMLGLGLTGLSEFAAGGDESSVGRTNFSEPGAGRGPQSGIPTGAVDATGFLRDESPTLNNSGLKHSYDGYGRDIFIEKETDDGKPQIWYRRAPSGTIHRSERKGFGIRNSVVKEMGSEEQHATS
jgi:hypothetical protein